MNIDHANSILKKVRSIEIRTRHLVTDALAGHYHSAFKGRGINFEEVREYLPGDEIRSIDWNVTARTGKPFIKKFTEERELTILLLVDVSASGNFGSTTQSKRELAAELASTLAFSAIRNQDKVGLILFSDQIEQYIPPRKGRQHILRIIREVLFFQPLHKGTNLSKVLDFTNKVIPRRAITFLISDFQASDYQKALQLTGKRHDLVAISILDHREMDLPSIGWLTLEDSETGNQIEINTSDPKTQKTFRQFATQRIEQIQKNFRLLGIDSLVLKTGQPYISELNKFFILRGKKR